LGGGLETAIGRHPEDEVKTTSVKHQQGNQPVISKTISKKLEQQPEPNSFVN
jgi:hypothetical protein